VTTILVSGALANKPLSGGEAWVRMTWVRGLRRLGFEVVFAEQIDSSACVGADGRAAPFANSVNREFFEKTLADLAPDCAAALICDDGAQTAGLSLDDLVERARDCALLVNVSGHLAIDAVRAGPRVSAYIDVDPGFTQIWEEARPGSARLRGHDFFFTVGQNVGSGDCSIPSAGVAWRPLPPPVTLDDWPVVAAAERDRVTTISTWRSDLGALSRGDVTYPGKHHEWRRVIDLPARAPQAFEIALAIHPADEADREALERHGWALADPRAVAGDAPSFRAYVQQSGAEFSVAHGVYVQTASGWLSDRTVRYLASGKPALVQHTGVAGTSPRGEGLVTFTDVDEAARAANAIAREYDGHAQAARVLAEERFDAERVIGDFLEQVGVS